LKKLEEISLEIQESGLCGQQISILLKWRFKLFWTIIGR